MDTLKDYGLLTIDEVAALLKCSISTVRSMRRDRRIPPPIELSYNNHRWSTVMIKDWIEAGCPSPVADDVFDTNEGDNHE